MGGCAVPAFMLSNSNNAPGVLFTSLRESRSTYFIQRGPSCHALQGAEHIRLRAAANCGQSDQHQDVHLNLLKSCSSKISKCSSL